LARATSRSAYRFDPLSGRTEDLNPFTLADPIPANTVLRDFVRLDDKTFSRRVTDHRYSLDHNTVAAK